MIFTLSFLVLLARYCFLSKNRVHLTNNATLKNEEREDKKTTLNNLYSNRNINENDIPKEILNSKVLLHTNKNQTHQLYLISPLSQKRTTILESFSSDYALSNDKTKIAYIKMGKLYTMDMKTSETTEIAGNFFGQGPVSWSPNDEFIIVNHGPGTTKETAYSVETGKSVCTVSGHLKWIDDYNAFHNYYDEHEQSLGIKKTNIKTCTSNFLINSPEDKSYSISAVSFKDGKLVTDRYIRNPDDQNYGEHIYEKYDVNTGAREPYSNYESDKFIGKSKVEAIFSDLMNYDWLSFEEHENFPDWKLVTIQKNHYQNRDIFIVGPNETIIFVAKNGIAKWY